MLHAPFSEQPAGQARAGGDMGMGMGAQDASHTVNTPPAVRPMTWSVCVGGSMFRVRVVEVQGFRVQGLGLGFGTKGPPWRWVVCSVFLV